jgi:acetylglutamate kinase
LADQGKKAIVVKIGGSTLGSEDTTFEDIVYLQRQALPVVVIHGGGKIISQWQTKQGITPSFVRGERVTDQPTLEVVTAVLAGLVNKEIVAAINSLGGRAVGLSCADGALVQSRVASQEKGYVGTTLKIDLTPLQVLLQSGYVPVVAPVSLYVQDRPAGAPGVLNNNADIIAGELACAIGAARLVFLTDVAGILDREGRLLARLSSAEAESLLASGVASGGMIPKVRASINALATTGSAGIIDGRTPHALLREIETGSSGTTIQGN